MLLFLLLFVKLWKMKLWASYEHERFLFQTRIAWLVANNGISKKGTKKRGLRTIKRCFLDEKTLLYSGQLLLSFCHANSSTSKEASRDNPRYKIKNKQQTSRQVNIAYLLKLFFSLFLLLILHNSTASHIHVSHATCSK